MRWVAGGRETGRSVEPGAKVIFFSKRPLVDGPGVCTSMGTPVHRLGPPLPDCILSLYCVDEYRPL